MKLEFEAHPDSDLNTKPFPTTKWQGKVTVDLRWVASAAPFPLYGPPNTPEACEITLAGSNRGLIINIPYSDFMELWAGEKQCF